MAIVAEVLLASPALPLVDLAGSLPSREIDLAHAVRIDDHRSMVMVSVDDRSRDSFETELERHDEIDDATSLGRTADGWVYQVVVDGVSSLYEALDPAQFEGAPMETTITADGWAERKVFSDYEAFGQFRDRCETYDIAVHLRSISAEPADGDSQSQFGLTDRQREALALANSLGYYESPRQVSTAELADELGISAPAASELLRRAEQQLISQALGSAAHLNTRTA